MSIVGRPDPLGEHPHFSSNSDLIRELAETRKQLVHWKANHASMVELNQLLRDRPDLGDRAQRVTQLIEERDRLKQLLRELWEARTEVGENRLSFLLRGIWPDLWERMNKELET